MKICYLLLLPLVFLACVEDDAHPLEIDTYTLKILDENGTLVYDGGGAIHYYGGNDMALSTPTSKIPVADSLNFMVIFLHFEAPDVFKSAVLYERYYALDDDFGFKATHGTFRVTAQNKDWSEGVFSMPMLSDLESEFPLRLHPVWGEKITVSGRFRFARNN